MQIQLPENVKNIIEKLKISGFHAYIVGGCVRDASLGIQPHDWDITTSATPDQVKAIFPKTVDTGLKHGTVTVLMNKEAYEVTTYRIDGIYEDNRRPNSVTFTDNIVEDLRRRDFTVNAMAYNDDEGMLDVFNGISDLKKGIIRCVGDANERFNEDALRMLRAIRFAAQLGFEIEENTKEAIRANAQKIQNVSAERINTELTKTLVSNNPHKIELVYELGLMQYILPEFIPNIGLKQFNDHHIYTVDRHIYVSLLKIEPVKTLRWTMFLHDIGKGYTRTIDENGIGHFYGHGDKSYDIAEEVLSRLKFDNKTKSDILRLIKHHDYRIEPNPKQVRRAIHKIGEDLFEDYLKVRRADIEAQNPEYAKKNLDKLEVARVLYQQIVKSEQCISLKQLKINGNDLVEMGIEQGQGIGMILKQLLNMVLDDPSLNERQWLLEKAMSLYKKHSTK